MLTVAIDSRQCPIAECYEPILTVTVTEGFEYPLPVNGDGVWPLWTSVGAQRCTSHPARCA